MDGTGNIDVVTLRLKERNNFLSKAVSRKSRGNGPESKEKVDVVATTTKLKEGLLSMKSILIGERTYRLDATPVDVYHQRIPRQYCGRTGLL